MEPTRKEMVNAVFRDLLRYGLHGSDNSTHGGGHQGRLVMPQIGKHRENHNVNDTAKSDDTFVDNGAGGKTSWREIRTTKQLVGQALEDRRTLARDRILRGGWTTCVTKTAIELTKRMVWKDQMSGMTSLHRFIHTFVELGEFCNDLEAIGSFLDGNIHRLIAFHAMEKDFKIPDPITRRVDQTTYDDGSFKYAWFRSVLQELLGLDTGGAAIWLQPYRANGEKATTGSPENGSARNNIEVLHLAEEDNNTTRGRKRARESDEELDMVISTTKVKLESIEDVSIDCDPLPESPSNYTCNGTTSTQMRDDHGENEMGKSVDRRTLTVLFHGMGTRSDGVKESEHVQVYVPRTAKGVTINLL